MLNQKNYTELLEESLNNKGIDVSLKAESDYKNALAGVEELIEKCNSKDNTKLLEELYSLKDEINHEFNSFNKLLERLESPYKMSEELKEVVNTARFLGMPLILQGEPGTGKTALAYYLAGQEGAQITHTTCNSKTTIRDLLYKIDNIERLTDSQLGEETSDITKYVELGDLGKLIYQCSAEGENMDTPPILLIDEIDKSHDEVLNDILDQIEHLQFRIPELNKTFSIGETKPTIILTSNGEKELPEAFLRRCMMYDIPFPTPEEMTNIIELHIPDLNQKLLEEALQFFYETRENESLNKKPSTSEFINWVKYLDYKYGSKNIDFNKLKITNIDLSILIKKADDLDIIDKMLNGDENNEKNKEAVPNYITAFLCGDMIFEIEDSQLRNLFNSKIKFTYQDRSLKIEGLKEYERSQYGANNELYSKLKEIGLIIDNISEITKESFEEYLSYGEDNDYHPIKLDEDSGVFKHNRKNNYLIKKGEKYFYFNGE